MDIAKCNALKRDLATQREPQIVPIDHFFDGNDDLGSIGCNLMKDPGIEAFRSTFAALRKRPDVQAVYARITELDPGQESWPFTDTVLIVGSISTEELQGVLAPLEPDEVGLGDPTFLPLGPGDSDRQSILVAWWD